VTGVEGRAGRRRRWVRSGEDADRRLYSYIDRIDETRHERGWRAEATNYLGLGWRR
jgi:hypothetical protein